MRHLILIFILVFFFGPIIGQSGQWYINAEKQVGANTAFSVEFVLENAKGSNFRPPNFNGFQVLSGPSYSSTTQIINGRGSSKQSYIYELMAANQGEFTIGTASININNVQHNTSPFKIKVVKGKDLASIIGDNDMQIKMELSDSSAYPGQQIILNYVLYYRDQVRFNGIVKEDEFKGLFAQRIQVSNQTKRVVQNGEVYQSSVIGSIAIFPQKSGDFPIEPCVVKIGVASKKQTSRGFFSFQQYDNQLLTAEPLTLKVRELPANAPEGFDGAVGTFEVTAAINKNTTTTDDAIVIHLTVKGDGDIRLLNAPQLSVTDDWEVYEPTVVEENEYIQANRIFNFKKFEYLLLPKATGQLPIAPSFVYYNVDSSSYKTIKINPFYITVTQGNRKVLAEDSRILSDRAIAGMISTPGISKGKNPFTSFWYLGSLGLLLMSVGGMFVRKRQVENYSSLSREERQKREAEKLARRRLKLAEQYKKDNNPRMFFEEISTAMNGFLADKYNIQHSEISKDLLKSKLQEQFSSSTIATDYYQLLQQCEMALFAGQSGANKMGEIYDLSLDLISKIVRG